MSGTHRTSVVVGGGPVGPTTSLLLSRLGVEHLLLERHRDAWGGGAHHPRRRERADGDSNGEEGAAWQDAAPGRTSWRRWRAASTSWPASAPSGRRCRSATSLPPPASRGRRRAGCC
ncbi:hypothetical protein DQ238_16580 [Geodermatophilus sp. TF02-6]|uniref:FAD-dependent monooxygenase n=1 Tax=Geodermatophilus sp. TF02-6 TaxID=2250575 RepID=UPI000DE9C31C|nr:hypothetical protein DQ238_16580 [Geodermatophilus sp. TF02-6]